MGIDLKAMNDEGDGFGKAEREPAAGMTLRRTIYLRGEYIRAEIESDAVSLNIVGFDDVGAMSAAEEIGTIKAELDELEMELRKR